MRLRCGLAPVRALGVVGEVYSGGKERTEFWGGYNSEKLPALTLQWKGLAKRELFQRVGVMFEKAPKWRSQVSEVIEVIEQWEDFFAVAAAFRASSARPNL